MFVWIDFCFFIRVLKVFRKEERGLFSFVWIGFGMMLNISSFRKVVFLC